MTIEDNIPPPPKRVNIRATLRALANAAPGASVYFSSVDANSATVQVTAARVVGAGNYETKSDENGIRVWRR